MLVGQAVMPPACNAPDFCSKATFYSETGDCTIEELPEGASCSTGNLCMKRASAASI